MKFKCKTCVDDSLSNKPCYLIIKGAKDLKYDREGWEKALRRCPFEDERNRKLCGTSPVAEWCKVKKK